jgi:hypothetical protein
MTVVDIKGKVYLIEQSRHIPFFLKLNIGMSEMDTRIMYGYFQVEGDINLLKHRELTGDIGFDYREN